VLRSAPQPVPREWFPRCSAPPLPDSFFRPPFALAIGILSSTLPFPQNPMLQYLYLRGARRVKVFKDVFKDVAPRESVKPSGMYPMDHETSVSLPDATLPAAS
jgi:hypothetical protein